MQFARSLRPITRVARIAAAATFVGVTAAACPGSDARVSVEYRSSSVLPRDLFTVQIQDGARVRTLRGAQLDGREFSTATSGSLRFGYRAVSSTTVVSEGSVEVPLRDDWRYGFDIFVDSLDPRRGCFGCVGAQAFPLAAAFQRSAKDSVWIVWGGNSISNPAIY